MLQRSGIYHYYSQATTPFNVNRRILLIPAVNTAGSKAYCHTGGADNVTSDKVKKDVDTYKVLRTMVNHVWPKDQFSLKVRVVSAFGLLLGSKVICDKLFKNGTSKICGRHPLKNLK